MPTPACLPAPRPAPLLGLGLALGLAGAALAFPPAPFHRVTGMVRTEMGDPLNLTNAVVFLETDAGVRVKTSVKPNLGPGRNYALSIPMDSGTTGDNYKATALRAAMTYRMKVQVGAVTYLPIETALVKATLGRPAQVTQMDLTLGEDTDGDGLPDAWERALMAMLGSNRTLADIRPGDDSDGDGIPNLAEYRAGTYAFDPEDGFKLEVVGTREGRMVLEFLAIPGRRYEVQAGNDLSRWVPATFRLPSDAANAPRRTEWIATRTQLLRIEAEPPSTAEAPESYFKAVVR